MRKPVMACDEVYALLTCRSEGFQAHFTKLRTRAFNSFATRSFDIIEGVVELEFVPLESSHLMEWKYVNPFYISKAAGKFRNLRDVVVIIGETGNEHKPQP